MCERWLYRWLVVGRCGKENDHCFEHFWDGNWIESIAAVKMIEDVDARNRNDNPAYFSGKSASYDFDSSILRSIECYCFHFSIFALISSASSCFPSISSA